MTGCKVVLRPPGVSIRSGSGAVHMENEEKDNAPVKEESPKPFMKRTIQDSVFTSLFQDKRYLIQLYRALHPEDMAVTEDDIVTVTIQNILTDSSYNDLGFLVGDLLLILVEAQSTWCGNIIVRAMMYLMQTYNEYFMKGRVNLYSSRKVKMPKPELYVIYTGDKLPKALAGRPEYITLSEEFFGGQECAVDARVKIIYDSAEGDIINQYIVFTKVCREQVRRYGRSREAISEAVRVCKDRNVLKEYLAGREQEVVDIMISLYDEQEIMERYVESEVAEAVEKAVEKAVEEAVLKTDKEASIRTFIEACQEFGATVAETIQKLINKYALASMTAENEVRKYWKE